MQYIYRFFNNKNECLYVGKTIRLKSRFNQHKKDKEWWNEVHFIDYAECEKEFMIDLYEIFYINKMKTKYNAKDIKIKYMKFEYPELEFKPYIFNNTK
jgi:excinuclease UvrABC nuclease subunit